MVMTGPDTAKDIVTYLNWRTLDEYYELVEKVEIWLIDNEILEGDKETLAEQFIFEHFPNKKL